MDDYPTPTYIRNHEKVFATYCYWPSFHDSPLLSLEHDEAASTVHLVVEVIEAGPLGADGYFAIVNRHSIVFRFFGVAAVDYRDFDVPNTLLEMTFAPVSDVKERGQFNVALQSVMGGGCTASFVAESGEVMSITACEGRK